MPNKTTTPRPAKEENLPAEANPEKQAPRLDRPSNREKRNGALGDMKNTAKETVGSAMGWIGNQCRKVQDTNPQKVAQKTSDAVERASSETTNFLKKTVTTSVSFAGGVAIGLARGGPSGLSDNALRRLRMRDGSGSLTEVAVQLDTEDYTENGIPKTRVYIQFLDEYSDLAPAIRAENSELPAGMAAVPLELAYEVTAKNGNKEIESYAIPLTGNPDGERETCGFLVLDREEGNPEVYAYNDA